MENGNSALHLAALRSAANWAPAGRKLEMAANMREIMQMLLDRKNVSCDTENNIGKNSGWCICDLAV